MNSLKLDRSWIEVDLIQLVENHKAYINALPKDFEIMSVVKADAYGHGAVSVVNALSKTGVSKFAVSNLNEAIELREAGINGEILILGYTSAALAEEIYKYDLIQTIVSEEHAVKLAEATKQRLKCHIAIDTGMNRIGLDADNPTECGRIIRKYYSVFDVCGIYTHLCVADSDNPEDIAFTLTQIDKFRDVCEEISDLEIKDIHCCNSAAGLFYSKFVADKFGGRGIVRTGIVLYGLKPDISNEIPSEIKPVLTWKTTVSMVKTVRVGEFIGYGRTYRADRTMKIATLSTGYADGYRRDLSNKGYVLIHGKRAPIVGRICMDQMMVDVTKITDVQIGDTATLIGEDGQLSISADELAASINTIGYEFVCGISKRVQRIIK